MIAKKMEKSVALKYAKAFCEKNAYDFDHLSKLQYVTVNDAGGFCFAPLNNGEGGLTVDRESQPRPVLVVQGDFTIKTYHLIEELKIK